MEVERARWKPTPRRKQDGKRSPLTFAERVAMVGRFMANVQLSGDPGGCWQWVGGKVSGKPYGVFFGRDSRYDARSAPRKAHRVGYYLCNGHTPRNLQLDHVCGNTLCVNPAHLEPVTDEENRRRRVAKRMHKMGL